MTKTECIIRSILGAVGKDIRPLAHAIDIAMDLLFIQKIPMDDILVTKYIYPDVAKRMNKKLSAASRQIERIANDCWDCMVDKGLVMQYIGAELKDINAPKDLIFYLAFYTFLDIPFFTAVSQRPALLF